MKTIATFLGANPRRQAVIIQHEGRYSVIQKNLTADPGGYGKGIQAVFDVLDAAYALAKEYTKNV